MLGELQHQHGVRLIATANALVVRSPRIDAPNDMASESDAVRRPADALSARTVNGVRLEERRGEEQSVQQCLYGL